MKTPLSSKLIFLQVVLSIFILALLAGWIRAIQLEYQGIRKGGLIALPVLAAISAGVLWLVRQRKKLAFDNDFLYIRAGKREEKIPLQNIYKLKLIMIEVNGQNLYKISYLNNAGMKESARFKPVGTFKDFEKLLQEKNPSAEIRHWSHSFDIDI